MKKVNFIKGVSRFWTWKKEYQFFISWYKIAKDFLLEFEKKYKYQEFLIIFFQIMEEATRLEITNPSEDMITTQKVGYLSNILNTLD